MPSFSRAFFPDGEKAPLFLRQDVLQPPDRAVHVAFVCPVAGRNARTRAALAQILERRKEHLLQAQLGLAAAALALLDAGGREYFRHLGECPALDACHAAEVLVAVGF